LSFKIWYRVSWLPWQ